MSITAQDAFLAELNGMKRLAKLPRPGVALVPEVIDGALFLWNSRGTGSHFDSLRLDPGGSIDVARLLMAGQRSPLRVPGGGMVVRALDGATSADNEARFARLASEAASHGCLMERPLDGIHREQPPQLRSNVAVRIGLPESNSEYLEARRLVDGIFRGRVTNYDLDTDFYYAPGTITYVAAWDRKEVISGASVLIVDGIANIWSVATRESARGQGVASRVVHASLVEAGRQGAHAATLGTSEQLARTGAIYNRLGFETIGHEKGWTIRDFDTVDL